MKPRIILSHINNNLPDYVRYTLKQYNLSNPNTKIDFLCHKHLLSNENLKMLKSFAVEVVDVAEYSDPLLTTFLEVCYLNQMLGYAPNTVYPSQPYFWQSGVERLFYICIHMKRRGYTNIFHFENDNLVYYDIEDIDTQQFNQSYITAAHMDDICTLTSALYVPNPEALELVCVRINELFEIPYDKLVSTYNNVMVHEMTLLSVCAKEGLVEHFHTLPPSTQKHLFDGLDYGRYICGTNNLQPAGFYTTEYNNIVGCKVANMEIFPYFDQEKQKPMVRDGQNNVYSLFNLHVHNKNLKSFMSL